MPRLLSASLLAAICVAAAACAPSRAKSVAASNSRDPRVMSDAERQYFVTRGVSTVGTSTFAQITLMDIYMREARCAGLGGGTTRLNVGLQQALSRDGGLEVLTMNVSYTGRNWLSINSSAPLRVDVGGGALSLPSAKGEPARMVGVSSSRVIESHSYLMTRAQLARIAAAPSVNVTLQGRESCDFVLPPLSLELASLFLQLELGKTGPTEITAGGSPE